MSPEAVFQQFADALLALIVKPSDGAAAREKLPTLEQGDQSVEHLAALFKRFSNHVTVGSLSDATSLAGWLALGGLKPKVYKGIIGPEPLNTTHVLDSVLSAADEIEAKPSFACKQVHPSLNAPQHDTTGAKPKRGGRVR